MIETRIDALIDELAALRSELATLERRRLLMASPTARQRLLEIESQQVREPLARAVAEPEGARLEVGTTTTLGGAKRDKSTVEGQHREARPMRASPLNRPVPQPWMERRARYLARKQRGAR
jgi:hypothetical protein